MPQHSWLEQASCRGHDTNAWFVETETDASGRRKNGGSGNEGERVCSACSVRLDCLADAMALAMYPPDPETETA